MPYERSEHDTQCAFLQGPAGPEARSWTRGTITKTTEIVDDTLRGSHRLELSAVRAKLQARREAVLGARGQEISARPAFEECLHWEFRGHASECDDAVNAATSME